MSGSAKAMSNAEHCTIECYLHGSMFDLRTGAALNLPAVLPVPVYPCVIVGDQILVDIDHPSTHRRTESPWQTLSSPTCMSMSRRIGSQADPARGEPDHQDR